MLITETAALRAFCEEALAPSQRLYLDTEFVRERTYYPRLCLIQVAGDAGDVVAVDALSEALDIEPLLALLYDPGKEKVLHAPRQDLEIFVQRTGRVPTPLFDTQLAAMMLGYGEQPGYATLVQRLLDVRLPKAQQFTDWARRPLTPPQLAYALDDVRYLRDCYGPLKQQLEARGRLVWLQEEMQPYTNPAHYAQDPEEAWRRLKRRSDKAGYLARLQALARWREHQAMQRNKPRGRILGDDTLQEMALTNPTTEAMLARVRGLPAKPDMAASLLALIAEANALDPAARPAPPPRMPLDAKQEWQRDVLKLWARQVAAAHALAPSLIGGSEDFTALVRAPESANHPLRQGWRDSLFGAEAAAFLRGERTFTLSRDAMEAATHPPARA